MVVKFRLQDILDSRDPPLSQSELARQSGVSFATINNIANNRTAQVSLRTLGDLATVLGIEPGELLAKVTRSKQTRR